jgi:hypothetical protein
MSGLQFDIGLKSTKQIFPDVSDFFSASHKSATISEAKKERGSTAKGSSNNGKGSFANSAKQHDGKFSAGSNEGAGGKKRTREDSMMSSYGIPEQQPNHEPGSQKAKNMHAAMHRINKTVPKAMGTSVPGKKMLNKGGRDDGTNGNDDKRILELKKYKKLAKGSDDDDDDDDDEEEEVEEEQDDDDDDEDDASRGEAASVGSDVEEDDEDEEEDVGDDDSDNNEDDDSDAKKPAKEKKSSKEVKTEVKKEDGGESDGEGSDDDDDDDDDEDEDPKEKMERTVFVGCIPQKMTRKQVKALFRDCGEIESVSGT